MNKTIYYYLYLLNLIFFLFIGVYLLSKGIVNKYLPNDILGAVLIGISIFLLVIFMKGKVPIRLFASRKLYVQLIDIALTIFLIIYAPGIGFKLIACNALFGWTISLFEKWIAKPYLK